MEVAFLSLARSWHRLNPRTRFERQANAPGGGDAGAEPTMRALLILALLCPACSGSLVYVREPEEPPRQRARGGNPHAEIHRIYRMASHFYSAGGSFADRGMKYCL